MSTLAPSKKSSLPSLEVAIKAIPLRYERLLTKSTLLNRKLKTKLLASDKAKIKQQLVRLTAQLQPYQDYAHRLFTGDKPTALFEHDLQRPLEKLTTQWIKTIKAHPFDAGIYRQLQEFEKIAFPVLSGDAHFLEKHLVIQALAQHPLVPSGVKLAANDEYSHLAKREKFATSQLANTLTFFKDSCQQWPYELDMIAMYLSDGVDHYRLGVELLRGNPKKIDEASDMDTASRDYIDDQVWSFIQNEVCSPGGSYLRNEALVRARKHKKILVKALPTTSRAKPVAHL